ncbi:MAG: hypothetical protein JSS81_16360 [Acidobacteria bacterium]|nr:hypothetical protein [Acidobacteriota bacterium]
MQSMHRLPAGLLHLKSFDNKVFSGSHTNAAVHRLSPTLLTSRAACAAYTICLTISARMRMDDVFFCKRRPAAAF